MSLDTEQIEFLDRMDNSTEQAFISGQYATIILRKLREWKAEERPASIDALIAWAEQREHRSLAAGMLAGMALAVEWEDHPHSQPGH